MSLVFRLSHEAGGAGYQDVRKVIDKPFERPLLHTVQSAGYRVADIAQPVAAG